jgi:hypothetical protein
VAADSGFGDGFFFPRIRILFVISAMLTSFSKFYLLLHQSFSCLLR